MAGFGKSGPCVDHPATPIRFHFAEFTQQLSEVETGNFAVQLIEVSMLGSAFAFGHRFAVQHRGTGENVVFKRVIDCQSVKYKLN